MATVRVVHPHQRQVEVASGAMTRLSGVSLGLVGARHIYMGISTVPPGHRSSPHWHVNCESALYVVRGHGRFVVGEGLKEAHDIGPGDFIYIPPGAIHQPVNLSTTEPLEFVVARNTPEEIVEEYTPPP